MGKAHVDPAELRRFAQDLGRFNAELQALVSGLTEHIMQLKGQVDAYHAKNYTKAAALTRASYAHMFMLGDALAAGIAKKFPQKFA